MNPLANRIGWRLAAAIAVRACVGVIVTTAIIVTAPASQGGVPTWHDDVVPLLLRSGCSAIACHGSADGQDGFKLSLRMMVPETDFPAVVDRIDSADVTHSLLVRKATGAVDHTGGEVWPAGGPEVALVERWVHAGMPRGDAGTDDDPGIERLVAARRLQCRVGETVRFDVSFNGSGDRDVTLVCETQIGDPTIARVESPGVIRGLRRGNCGVSFTYQDRTAFAQLVVHDRPLDGADEAGFENSISPRSIDDFADRTLADLGTPMADPADPMTLRRRIAFDLTGRPPSDADWDQWRRRIEAITREHPDPDDRRRAIDRAVDSLVDRLLQSDQYAEKWGRWFSELMGLDELRLGSAGFAMKVDREKLAYQWLAWNRDRIAADASLLDMVTGHLAANSRNGRSLGEYQDVHGRWTVAMRSGQWKTSFAGEPTNDLFWKAFDGDGNVPGEWLGRRVLAMDLQCARCHDHPHLNITMASHHAFDDAVGSIVHHEQTLTAAEKRKAFEAALAIGLLAALGTLGGGWLWRRRRGKAGPADDRVASKWIIGFLLGGGLMVIASYPHLWWSGGPLGRAGAGPNVRMWPPDGLADWGLVSGLMVLAVVCLGAAAIIRQRTRARAAARIALIALGTLIGGVAFDVAWVSPSIGGHSSSWMHGLHRAVLARAGFGGQGQQPREVYRSLEARPVDLESLDRLDVTADPSADDPRESLARFLAHEDPRRRMARNLVNRVWKQIFGEGLSPNVNEVSARFPPDDPPLLEFLTDGLVRHDGSLRWLLGQMLNSRIYRRASDAPDPGLACHSPRLLDADERFELIRHATGSTATISPLFAPPGASAYEAFVRARIRTGVDRLLRELRFAAVDSPQDVPLASVQIGRSDHVVQSWIESDGGRAARFADAYRNTTDADERQALIDRLWVNVFGRVAGSDQASTIRRMLDTVRSKDDATPGSDSLTQACQDLLWVLLNNDRCFLNE